MDCPIRGSVPPTLGIPPKSLSECRVAFAAADRALHQIDPPSQVGEPGGTCETEKPNRNGGAHLYLLALTAAQLPDVVVYVHSHDFFPSFFKRFRWAAKRSSALRIFPATIGIASSFVSKTKATLHSPYAVRTEPRFLQVHGAGVFRRDVIDLEGTCLAYYILGRSTMLSPPTRLGVLWHPFPWAYAHG